MSQPDEPKSSESITPDVAWISKYALTKGVYSVEIAHKFGEYVSAKGLYHSFKLGRDAWPTRAEALIEGEAMRKKRIASLRKSIAKLEKLVIKVKEPS